MSNLIKNLTEKTNFADLRKYSTMHSIKFASHQGGVILVNWSDGVVSEFDETWLYENCYCPDCVHPSTHERIFHITERSCPGVKNISARQNLITIEWSDQHISTFAAGWLRSYHHNQSDYDDPSTRYQSWDVSSLNLAEYHFNDLQKIHLLSSVIENLLKFGAIVITNAPNAPDSVTKVASYLGKVRATNFGESFEIQMKQNPISNADTEMEFLPHTDIAHHASPPGFQLLHFMVNSACGGESTLTDGYKVYTYLAKNEPECLEELKKPIFLFRFQDQTCDHLYKGRIIELDDFGNFSSIRFDPIGIQPMLGPTSSVRKQRIAIKTLMEILVKDEFRYRRKFESGDIVIFENTRLLHGRTAFKAGDGERKLKGCYVDLGDVVSTSQVLNRNLNNASGIVLDDAGKIIMKTVT